MSHITAERGVNTMSKQSSSGDVTQKEMELLNFIHSLHIVSENQIGPGDLAALHQQGWVRKVWIGNYILTEAGKRARTTGFIRPD